MFQGPVAGAPANGDNDAVTRDLSGFVVEAAIACKGCAPPCICPGSKGEKGVQGFIGEIGHP
ncbi:unnamed protein product, partial [Strongylus vulgaris]